ncbi:hypothetical protein B0H16DRAFT_551202 [Mycena metata]|uniref:DUF6535 domain-containing protein n=1 Tax=Mycena metata TaxID=1033252 RepID=A0AAD7H683_9AGAR|nr:hypothetical protein B0H16DRAFT_551202 [Mycena metata]
MQAPNSDDDAAASKVWAVYVSEAEKYDRSLVESWKSDMEGMLIFAGLFSASLTAFIIESYKMLVPDSGDSTVQLLAQISQQLQAAANGSIFHVPPPTHFSPPTTSLVCNTLWFISLGLSLACALIATLLEQWARDFLHKTDMRSAPVIRARVFSFLYYGLKRFNMHTVVDIIPLLLHTSLLFFFAGLVAFLLPINHVITYIAVGLLVVVVAAYTLLTVLPVWYLDCPYRTPLSAAFWSLSQFPPKRWLRRDTVERRTVVEAIFDEAMTVSPARVARDYQALAWTVKSLADNTELEPFVDGLPDLLWGPDDRRYTYEDHIQQLTRAEDVGLLSRIKELLQSCDSGLLSEEACKRREITCYKALWAIASTQTPLTPSSTLLPLDFSQIMSRSAGNAFLSSAPFGDWRAADPGIDHYRHSALPLMRWSVFCHVETLLAQVVRRLSAEVSLGLAPNLESLKLFFKRPFWDQDVYFPSFLLEQLLNGDPTTHSTLDLVTDFVRAFETFSKQTPYNIFFDYCVWAAAQETLPYRFFETKKIILPNNNHPAAFATYAEGLESALSTIAFPPSDSPKWTNPTTQCFDVIIQQLCACWRPEDSDPRPIPRALIRYLAARKIHSIVHDCLHFSGIIPRLLRAMPTTLSQLSDSLILEDALDDVMVTLWHVALSLFGHGLLTAERSQPILDAISPAPVTPVMFSAITLLKMLVAIVDESAPPGVIDPGITLLTEFLEAWTSSFTPYEPTLTMNRITSWLSTPYKVDEAQQLRLAASMSRALAADNPQSFEVLDALMKSSIFSVYQHEGSFRVPGWLDNPTARNQIKGILSDHLRRPRSTPAPDSSARLARVLRALGSLHPTED